MSEKLTVLIPCKNERLNILACIESVQPIADEILVADSGSTDGTPEIAQNTGQCRVIHGEWSGYAAFKNWAISQAAHPWVLIVDADERVTPELGAEIRTVLVNPPPGLDAYRIRHRTFFLGHEIRHCGRNTTSACRLIRRDVCRYRNVRVHEEIGIAPARVGRLKHRFIHYEYRCYDHYFAKRLQYTRLSAEDRWHVGKRAGVFGLLVSPFLRFFQLYFLRLGFLDGLAGVQICMLTAFLNSFVKQARLWEMQYAVPQETVERLTRAVSEDSLLAVPRSLEPHSTERSPATPECTELPAGPRPQRAA